MQNYLVFWQIFKYFKTLANSSKIEESIKTSASDKRLDSGLNYINSYKKQVKLDESFFKWKEVTFSHKTILNCDIFYETFYGHLIEILSLWY